MKVSGVFDLFIATSAIRVTTVVVVVWGRGGSDDDSSSSSRLRRGGGGIGPSCEIDLQVLVGEEAVVQ
jgi:hypothetical protein